MKNGSAGRVGESNPKRNLLDHVSSRFHPVCSTPHMPAPAIPYYNMTENQIEWGMEYEKLLPATTIVITTIGGVFLADTEYRILVVIITGFVLLFTVLIWPEYEEYEQLYNPANEAEKLSQWEIIKEGFLKAG